jgi:1,4-dihydroxy-2-naphthoate octaprenyltransferase
MLKSIVLAFRPKTLTAALIPIFVGSGLAYSQQGFVVWKVVLFSLVSALSIQIATNLFNDAIDFKKGADDHQRIGPQRVTQSKLLTPKQVYLFAGIFLVLALSFGIPLVIRGGWVIVSIGIVSMFLAYGYTGGPLPLAYKGLGDLFVILFFGIIAVGGVYYLHTLDYKISAFVSGLQVGVLATVLIAINNLRDINQDRLANKKTLAVRFGENFIKWEIVALLMSSFFLGIYWIFLGKILAAALPLVLLPVVRKLITGVVKEVPGPIYNDFLAQAALIHLVFGLQLTLGLVLNVS